jgi:hemerythrin
MDDQHGILMDTINDLHLASVHGAGRETVSVMLNQLIGFARMHFASEEQLMEQYGFPGLEQHRAEHRRLLAQLLESAHRVQHGQLVAVRPLLEFLRDWFMEHMGAFDRQYAPWFNERGVS